MTMTPYPNPIAGNTTEDPFVPFELFAGEKEVVTNRGTVALSQTLKQFQVVAFDASGNLVAHAPAATDGTQIVVGVMAQAITTTASATGDAPYYVSGFFNHEALAWDASLTTLAARRAAVVGSGIQVGALYGAAS